MVSGISWVQSALKFFKTVFLICLNSLQLFEIFHTFKEFIKYAHVFFFSFILFKLAINKGK